MTAVLRLFALTLWGTMLAVDSLYGHLTLGKIAAALLFIVATSLALASLDDEEKPLDKKD